MQRLWKIIIVVGIVIILAGISLVALMSPNNSSGVASLCSDLGATTGGPNARNTAVEGNASSSANSSNASFLIVQADPGSSWEGMNESAYHPITMNWPTIHVFKDQRVTIRIINCSPGEAHGFSISHYFVAGVTVREGQSYNVTFSADTTGTFRIFCDIFCAIHPLMQNGLLIVT